MWIYRNSVFFFSSRRRHTRLVSDWSSDVCSSDLLTGTILVVLVADLFLPRERKWVCMPIAFVGVIGALIAALTLINANRTTFGGMYVVDNFAVLFKVFFLSTAAVVLGLSLRYMRDGRYFQGEYYVLLLAAVLGCVPMPSSRYLLV